MPSRVLAAEDDQDLDSAAAALSKSRHWVLTALRAGGDMQTVKQLRTAWLRPGIRSRRTIQTALAELEAARLAAGSEEGNAHGTSHGALVRRVVTDLRTVPRKILTGAGHHHENQAAARRCCPSGRREHALLGPVAASR
jgi:hypothetical protein